MDPPRDKWYLIYIIFMIHGLGATIGWNMFIMSKDYFVKYKLANAPAYADHYLAYVGWAAQIPNCLFSWINIFMPLGGALTTRIVWSLIVEVALFVVTVVLAMVDSSKWPIAFFWITMVSVLVINSCNAIFQSSVYGVTARLPDHYTGAVVLGSNICGMLVVFISWSSELLANRQTSAIYYFITGILVLMICFDTYFALPLNRFYRYYDTMQQRTGPASRWWPRWLGGGWYQAPEEPKVPYRTILKQSRGQLYNVFISYFVSLSIFPSVYSDIEPVQPGFLGDKFMAITCFLTFEITATVGNITANIWQFPSKRWLWVLTTVRILFIPFFLMCKYKSATRTLPIWVGNDWVYWAVGALLGWTTGQCSTLGMMYVRGSVAPENASIAGMFGAAMLVTGILLGLVLTRACPLIVTVPIV